MITGEDPHAWKDLEERIPFKIRPSGKSGNDK